jgi:hypothetical protein
MRTVVAVLSLALFATQAAAQACPPYDSLVHLPPTHSNHFRSKYDRLPDSTYYNVDPKLAVAGMLSRAPDITLILTAAHEGQVARTPVFYLQVLATTVQSDASDHVENRPYLNQVENAFVLVDDSMRLRLPKFAYSSQVKDDMLVGRHLDETLLLRLTVQDWAGIAGGTHLTIRIGSRDITTGGSQPEGARNVLRRLLCPQ